ncbi:MAG: hypothetical protein J6L71_01200 [Clostridia bacterium]|nr:hypothetical protein [Clostridia bacterium]
MKKIYVKPEIKFESFKMSSSIANDCAVSVNEIDVPDGYNLFVTGCEVVPADGDFGGCYHVPTAETKVFGS